MTYTGELARAMTRLGEDARAVFVGINIVSGGQSMHPTFAGVPREKLIEFPVAEDLQMGFCTGLALAGYLPICVYPRWDFLLLAANQLVNHLDKMPVIAGVTPKVIIRVAVGPTYPLHGGPQHTQDHSKAFRRLLTTVHVETLPASQWIVPSYEAALAADYSTNLVEYGDLYR